MIKEILEEAEDGVVEVVKALFKVAGKLFDWMIGE